MPRSPRSGLAGLAALLLVAGCAAAQDAPATAPAAAPASAPVAQPWLEMPGIGDGPGAGKHIVLISGDEEYRSEEALPMLARILSTCHGFRCTVLFAQDADGTVNPNEQGRIPGMQALDDADLLVLFTRFRHLPEEDIGRLQNYLKGKPVFGIRTATHAFAYPKESVLAGWSWDAPSGGFGKRLFGTSWVAHLGHHGSESTRGLPTETGRTLPMLRGVTDVWGLTDVYAVAPLPADATVLMWGQILSGLSPDSAAVTDERSSPATPLVWIRQISPNPDANGLPPQRTACSTIGAAQDLRSEDLRRLFVNLCYWCTGLEQKIPEKNRADIVGRYEPTPFGFDGFKKGKKPADFDTAPPAR
jgi:hypothetical protein